MISSWENTPSIRDRRKSPRYDIMLPLESSGELGLTHNLSFSGLFFETKQPVSLGESIRLTLKLDYWDPDNEALVYSSGRVVRVEPGRNNFGEDYFGVAVAIDSDLMDK